MAVKYIDFGLACFRNECERERWSEGSPGYMAPELHKRPSGKTKPSFASFKQADIWALGMLFFTVLAQGTDFFDRLLERRALAAKWLPDLPLPKEGQHWQSTIQLAKFLSKLEDKQDEIPQVPVDPFVAERFTTDVRFECVLSRTKKMLSLEPTARALHTCNGLEPKMQY